MNELELTQRIHEVVLDELNKQPVVGQPDVLSMYNDILNVRGMLIRYFEAMNLNLATPEVKTALYIK